MGAAHILSSAAPAAVRNVASEAADGASGAAHMAGAQGTLDLRCRAVDIEGTRRTVVDTVAQAPPLRSVREMLGMISSFRRSTAFRDKIWSP